jgi:hypothetical protein
MAVDPKDWGMKLDNEWLARELYDQASKRVAFLDFVANEIPTGPGPSRWTRLRRWIADHAPRMHFGPCDHSECE